MILVVFITCINPVTIDHVFGLLVFVPIICGCAVTADEEIANIALKDGMAAFVGDQRLIARYKLTGAAWFDLSYTVADEDVQNLCTANAIENLYMEGLLEAAQDIGGQRFTRGDTDAYR